MTDMNTCDSCGTEDQVLNLFWDCEDPINDGEAIVLDEMAQRQYSAVCRCCFKDLLLTWRIHESI